jgi:plastocyanin
MRQTSCLATLLIVALLVLMPTAGAQQQETQGTGDQGAATPPPNVWKVSIRDFSFYPADATIASGDAIVFINEDNVAHTVTSDDGQFDSGPLKPGEYVPVSFEGSGTLMYHCEIHPEMVGSVTVVGGSGGEAPTSGEPGSDATQPTSEPTQTASETMNVPSGTQTNNETMG